MKNTKERKVNVSNITRSKVGKYSDFGLASLKAEGKAMHPEDLLSWTWEDDNDQTDKWYLMQLQAFKDWAGHDTVNTSYCSRPHLLEKLK